MAVEHVESVLKKNTLFDQIWVYGNSFENFLVAVVVPNEAQVLAFAEEKKLSGSYAELCADDKVKKFVLDETFKMKRPQFLKFFKEQVDAMYAFAK